MYTTRYTPFGRLEVIELPEGQKGSAKPDVTRVLTAEADTILNKLDSDTFVIALDETGMQFSSQDLANLMANKHSKFQILKTKFAFIIGGSWGLDRRVLDRADLKLSLGKVTLPHALARIVLIEQLYRVQTIICGKKYHK